MRHRLIPRSPLLLALLLALAVGVISAPPALAQQGDMPGNDRCLLCHTDPELTMVLPSREVLPLNMNPVDLAASVHAELLCSDCHNDKGSGYPHPPFPAANHRDWQVMISQVCGNCHADQALHRQDSMHGRLLAAGRSEAATCIDCHGAHDVAWANWQENPAASPAAQIDACGECHNVITTDFRASVHGVQLIAGNEDVPTCSSCHPAHQIEDPRTAAFRLSAPELCGSCHADTEMMAQYGISTHVFDTYVADFHGTTVKIFEATDPEGFTNKAVCHDCHSAHRIMRADSANSTVMQANLLATCQRCHPDADAAFTASWMGHYPPDWEHYPIVTAVDWFYKLLIPGVLGFFVVYIGLDIGRTWIDRSRQRREWRQARRQQRLAASSQDEPQEGGEA